VNAGEWMPIDGHGWGAGDGKGAAGVRAIVV